MKSLNDILQQPRTLIMNADERGGVAQVLLLSSKKQKYATVIWSIDSDSNGEIWEHVSVSFSGRDPTWEEMCEVKNMFFQPEEECVQFHPKASEYVNIHPHCLHIWRNATKEILSPSRRK